MRDRRERSSVVRSSALGRGAARLRGSSRFRRSHRHGLLWAGLRRTPTRRFRLCRRQYLAIFRRCWRTPVEELLELSSNLEKFAAQEKIEYKRTDFAGVLKESGTGTFNYTFAFEEVNGGRSSREYRVPAKGSSLFPGSEQDTGQVALALDFPSRFADGLRNEL